jgi:hypothetical protein
VEISIYLLGACPSCDLIICRIVTTRPFAGLAGDDAFFDEDFKKDFSDLESGNKFYNKIEDGFRNWEERYESDTCL